MTSRFFARGTGLLAVAGLMLAGCGSDDDPSGDVSADLSVVAAFYPLAFVAERVAGDLAAVDNLTQPGVESHDLELTGQQVGRVADADLVLHLAGYQPAVDEAIGQSAGGEVVDVAAVVELLPDEHDDEHDDEDHDHEDHGDEEDHDHDEEHAQNGDDHGHDEDSDDHGHEDGEDHGHDEDDHADHDHDADEEDAHDDAHTEDDTHSDEDAHNEDDAHDDDHGHDHDHGDLEGDPHLWLDPLNMVAITDAVATSLASLDPDNAEAYQANAEELIAELEELDEEFHTGLASCERSLIVVSHEAFGYLAASYGLEQYGVAGLDPDAEPSPARIAEAHGVIEEAGVTTVFYERLTSPDVVQSLADDLGLDTAVLDPIEGLTDETADDDYLSLMRQNLDALRAANGCG